MYMFQKRVKDRNLYVSEKSEDGD